jgi:hypothetical protein
MARLSGPYHGFPGDTTRRSTTAEFPLGARALTPEGSEYVYVQAGAAIAQYDAVKLNGSAAGFDDVRPVTNANEFVLGVADAAFAADEYGFIQTRGVATCKVVASTAAGSPLVADATDGTLKLATEAESLAGNRGIVALVTGVAAGSAVYLH